MLDPEVQKRVQQWLDGPYDEETKAEIRKLQSDPKALTDAFYTDLTFGTGGLRGLMGVGSNRMNRYTVQRATQGLANYLLKQKIKDPSVVIGFDSRHHSKEFAQETAEVLAGNGIRALLLKELRPTPYISFACRDQKCTAAVMITASHNPAVYNGYKVYWSDGAQVVPPHDTGIMEEVHAVSTIKTLKNSPLITLLGEEIDAHYLAAIRPLQLFAEENQRNGKDLKISYTSLHGTGITMVPKALADWGFTSVNFVSAQIKPDGDFPTVKFPNPEFPETLKLGIEQLIQSKSDLLIATDPDADRLGVVVMHQQKPVILTGNEIASLCVHYLCDTLTAREKMPAKGAFITTIVTTELLKTIASAYSKPCFEVLTGFKYIGEKIHQWELDPKNGYQFLFGAEESYGYLLGTEARDKDAIVSSCLVSEMASQAKERGHTLMDELENIYRKYGIFREKQLSLSFDAGKQGMDQMSALMTKLRQHTPKAFLEDPVVALKDYETSTDLPKSDVLLLRLKSESKLVIRPSGTEPKIKIYAAVREKNFSSLEKGIAECDRRLDELLQSVKDAL